MLSEYAGLNPSTQTGHILKSKTSPSKNQTQNRSKKYGSDKKYS